MSRGIQDPHGPIYILTVRVNKMSGMTKFVYILTGECASDRHRVKPRIARARRCDKKSGFPWVPCDSAELLSQLRKKVSSLLLTGPRFSKARGMYGCVEDSSGRYSLSRRSGSWEVSDK